MGRVYNQAGDYIPATDDGFRSFLFNFASLISADPLKFGLTAADAVVIQDQYDLYNPLWEKCQQPSIRTTSLVQQKDAVKASAVATVRVYAQIIKANQGVDEESKSALGLRINDTTKTPIPAPETAPMLNVIGTFSGEHVIEYADSNTPNSKRKPPGAALIELYVYIGTNATNDFNKAKFVDAVGRNPLRQEFQPEDAGKIATYFARWRTAKGLVGPWSLPVCMTIAFGGPVEHQMFYPAPGGGQPGTQQDEGDGMKIAA